MTGKTHAIIGANAAWLVAVTGIPDSRVVFLSAAGAVAALLPDIDAANAKIHHVAGGVFGSFRNMGKHRSFFHSMIATLLVFIASMIFLFQYHPLLPLVITLGYASHPLIDGLNPGGVRYFYPLKKKFRILPHSFTSYVGGFFDQLLFAVGTFLFLGLMLMNYLAK